MCFPRACLPSIHLFILCTNSSCLPLTSPSNHSRSSYPPFSHPFTHPYTLFTPCLHYLLFLPSFFLSVFILLSSFPSFANRPSSHPLALPSIPSAPPFPRPSPHPPTTGLHSSLTWVMDKERRRENECGWGSSERRRINRGGRERTRRGEKDEEGRWRRKPYTWVRA